ncbi:MAG: type II secretion system protein GspD [Bacillota bacterium]
MKKLIVSVLFLFITVPLFAQRDLEKELSGNVNPEELVTLSENLSFNKAIEVLNKVSEKTTGKNILSTVSSELPIGIELTQIPFKKALTIIVQYANLMYEEKADVIVVKQKGAQQAELKATETYAPVNTREVKISAVFFEADVSEMKQQGINWQFLLSQRGVSVGTDLRTFTESNQSSSGSGSTTSSGTSSTQKVDPPDFKLSSIAKNFTLGKFTGDASAMFRFFEEENLGEIIASPSITVRNNQPGRIQIGSDFSIKQRDFSGNIIDKFFSSGSIIEVTPFMYTEDNVDYVLLKLKVERSSAFPSEVSTEIRKTAAETQVLMLNHEETVIGGLYVNEETKVRNGIPFLKDLPWWVFGIRYLTGSDQTEIKKKEVVILLKLDILPTLKERMNAKKEGNLIKQEIKNYEDRINTFKSSNKENK